jgi:hypothetical protein
MDRYLELFILEKIIKPIVDRKGIRIIFIKGYSGAGKTTLMIELGMIIQAIFYRYIRKKKRFTEELKQIRPFDIEKQVVYEPLEYKKKLEWFLNDPRPVLCIDELRFLIPAKLWQRVITQTFADINATIRAVKSKKFGYGGVFIYNSQYFEDIAKETRKTVKFLIDVKEEEFMIISGKKDIRSKLTYGKILNVLPFEAKGGSPIKVGYEEIAGYNVGGIFFHPLPRYIEEKIEEISSKAKAKISKLKTEALEKLIAKDYGIQLESDKNA